MPLSILINSWACVQIEKIEEHDLFNYLHVRFQITYENDTLGCTKMLNFNNEEIIYNIENKFPMDIDWIFYQDMHTVVCTMGQSAYCTLYTKSNTFVY